jgi:hypothetical protein
MARYRAGKVTTWTKLRLSLYGTLMVVLHTLADRATVRYRDAYHARYGEPTVGEVLGLEPTRH